MRKGPLPLLLACVSFAVALQSCRNDDYLTAAAPVANQSLVEEFDTVSSSLARGWVLVNASDPKGGGVWQQGGAVPPWFAPYSSSGTYAGFIGADYTSTSAGAGNISNWLISPPVVLQNGDKISFYTRSLQYADVDPITGLANGDSTDYGNRLQVAINTTNQSTNAGTGTDPGNFGTVLLDINPSYAYSHTLTSLYNATAFPAKWTRFEATVFGLNAPTKGRFAFRYFVEGGGSAGNGSGVAIDKVQYQSVSR